MISTIAMAPLSTVVSPTSPPGGLLEIVFSFDTTGSMCGYLDQVRGRLQDMIQRLQADIPGIRIAVFAHGDYCDRSTYVTKWEDFSNDVVRLCTFVSTVGATGGGDAPECYELVLRQVKTELTWTPGSRRALVLIGDDVPHEASEPVNKDNIDWRQEVRDLAVMGVTVYGVQCANRDYATPFYQTISTATSGKHLKLEDMGGIFDVLMAVCYREGNDADKFDNYEKEARSRTGAVGTDVDAIFNSLRDHDKVASSDLPSSPLPPKKRPTVTTPKLLKPAPKLTKVNKKNDVRLAKSKSVKRSRKPKVPVGLEKFQLKNLPKLKRENVPESNFQFREMKWSNWQPAFSPDLPASSACSATTTTTTTAGTQKTNCPWVKRVGRPGFRLTSLTTSDSRLKKSRSSTALHRFVELAVQQAPGRRRHVTFSRVTSHSLSTRNWEQVLLSTWARHQVDKALSQGHRVLVRHCLLQRKSQHRNTVRGIRRYDYAWCKAAGGLREILV